MNKQLEQMVKDMFADKMRTIQCACGKMKPADVKLISELKVQTMVDFARPVVGVVGNTECNVCGHKEWLRCQLEVAEQLLSLGV